MATRKKATNETVEIKAPNFLVAEFEVEGNAPYVANKFSEKARQIMREEMAQGGAAKKRKSANQKEAKDFDEQFRQSMHQSQEGWYGIPSTAFKSALVRAASATGVPMTLLKQCVFVLPDGLSEDGCTPLVRFTRGEPEKFEAYCRMANGSANITARGRWAPGWRCALRIQYDADILTPTTIAALLMRAGVSVGVGAGRPFSSASCGMGWGTFEIVREEATEQA